MHDLGCNESSFKCLLWWQVIEAGANALVAGSAVFGAKDYAEGINRTDRKTYIISPDELMHLYLNVGFYLPSCSYKRNQEQ